MSDTASPATRRGRAAVIWVVLAFAIAIPLGAAATSPLLAWRGPVYIVAGLAGVIAFALMLVQPMLVGGYLPGVAGYVGRRVHRWIGGVLVAAVVVHVAGLWIVSPPDVIDALTFNSPTPFSAWGVIAMWAIFAVAVLAMLRRRLRLVTWRIAHTTLALVIIVCSVVHAVLIEGTMETMSKVALSALIVAATLKVIADLRVWSQRRAAR